MSDEDDGIGIHGWGCTVCIIIVVAAAFTSLVVKDIYKYRMEEMKLRHQLEQQNSKSGGE